MEKTDERSGSQPGESLLGGRYEVLETIGRGGMSEVLRAHDVHLGRDVAVKVLREQADLDGDEAVRFASEAKVLALLSHPALVTLLDADVDGHTPYLVFELVDGRTLAEQIAVGPLDPAVVRALGVDVGEGLAYAHDRGVVHRDLKPSNILLRSDGRTKLADFGIARLLDEAARHTQTGFVVGSPAYLSPEQVQGAPLTSACDIYSFGLVLLEALTGDRPARGTPMEVVAARLSGPVAMPVGLDPAWSDLIVAMTDPAPVRRPDAATVVSRLRGLTDAAWEQGGTRTAVLPPGELTGVVDPHTTVVLDVPRRERVRATAAATRDGAVGLARRTGNPGAALAAVALVILLLVVGVVAAVSGGGDDPTGPATDVPSRYQDPLTELEDTVRGEQ